MNVSFTARARADLRGIGRWIARDNPARAVSFVTELREKALSLGDAHGRYPAISEAEEYRHLRRLNHGDYRIVYQVRAATDTVDILFIHHGARAYPSLP